MHAYLPSVVADVVNLLDPDPAPASAKPAAGHHESDRAPVVVDLNLLDDSDRLVRHCIDEISLRLNELSRPLDGSEYANCLLGHQPTLPPAAAGRHRCQTPIASRASRERQR
jgi:hypothetical protein